MTYAQLQADIKSTLNRQDMNGDVQRFIRLCESALDSELMGASRQVTKTLTTTGGYITVPANFRSLEHIEIDGAGELTPVYKNKHDGTREDFEADKVVILPDAKGGAVLQSTGGGAGMPCEYYISGNKIWLSPQPKNGEKVRLTYEGGIERLSDENTTNWVLDRYENLYLYGALLHSAPFLKNDKRITTWAALYRSALDRANQDYTDSQIPHIVQMAPTMVVI